MAASLRFNASKVQAVGQKIYQNGGERFLDGKQANHHDMEDQNGSDDLRKDDEPHLQGQVLASGSKNSLLSDIAG